MNFDKNQTRTSLTYVYIRTIPTLISDRQLRSQIARIYLKRQTLLTAALFQGFVLKEVVVSRAALRILLLLRVC